MIERTYHTPLPLTLDVSIPAGEVVVQTADGEETEIYVDGDETLLEHVEVRQDGNRIVVTMRGKSKVGFSFSLGSLVFGNNGLHVRAQVPHGADVMIKTASADVGIDGHVGRLDANTASGDVSARGLADQAKVKTVSGDVHVAQVGGDLSVQTVSGDIRAVSVGGGVDTKSVSGDIRLEGVADGDVRFASVSGDIEIGVAQGSLLDVDAGSTSGDLSSEVPLGSDVPQGEAGSRRTVVVRGRTVSGDVRVFRAG
jgi:DUF4097 and DUF4098 domain-containing protein YvlB